MTLPAGWRVHSLGEVAHTIRNGLFASRPREQPPGVPMLRISAVRHGRVELRGARFVDELDDATMAKFSITSGDLLVTRYNGSRRLVGISGLVGPHLGPVLHPDKLIRVQLDADAADSRFVNYQLGSAAVRAFLEPRIRTTAGQSGISGDDVRSIPLALPSLIEQRRIVELLDDHLSRMDAAQELVTRSRSRLRPLELLELQRAMDQFGGSEVPLSAFVDRIEAGRSFGGSAPPARADQWGIVKVSAMTWGDFRPTENKAVPDSAVDPRFEIKPGDLLVSRANTNAYVGAAVLVGDNTRPKLLLSDKSLRVVPRAGVDPRWLLAALTSPRTRSQISALATGTKDSMRNISQANLLGVQLPHGDVDARALVVQLRQQSAERGAKLALELGTITTRAENLRRSLLSAAFSGQLTSTVTNRKIEEKAVV